MEKNYQKICGIYVSDWHLTAMLLPYIESTIDKGEHLNTILEKNISYNMKELLSRLKISDRKKEEIMKIGWESKEILKYGSIKEYMEKITKENNKIIILVEGTKERIEGINKNIERWIKKSEKKLKSKEIKIINCYDVSEFNKDLNGILSKHDKLINTSGIHEISDIYVGYDKKEA